MGRPKISKKIFIEESIKYHGLRFGDYVNTDYDSVAKEITLNCPSHGSFQTLPFKHMRGAVACSGCNNGSGVKLNNLTFTEKAQKIHGTKYNYDEVRYVNAHSKILIGCPIHGEFEQLAYAHLQGKGCRQCAVAVVTAKIKGKKKEIDWVMRREVFLEKMKTRDYLVKTPSEYEHCNSILTFMCAKHGEFEMSAINMLRGCRCGACNSMSSRDEQTVVDCLPKTTYIKRNIKQFLGPYELDIFLPDHMVGIEVNGVKWHSDEKKHPEYHLTKTRLAEERGIQLYHFLDTEINEKLPIIQSMIQTKIGINKKIFARKTTVREVDSITARDFMQTNHIQGGNSTIGKYAFGLFHNEDLVSVMTFGDPRFDKNIDLELIRFASLLNHTIVGGASKLLKAARQKLGLDKSIISYANRRWSQGNLYKQLGFTHTHNSTTGYGYTNGNVLVSRMKAQKHKLKDLLGDVFDPTMTEEENMAMAGWNRVYDCGNMVFVLKQ